MGNTRRFTESWPIKRGMISERASLRSSGFWGSRFLQALVFTGLGGPTKMEKVGIPMHLPGRQRVGKPAEVNLATEKLAFQ